MKSAVIVFPGSNCDRDAKTVLAATGLAPQMVWHGDSELPKVDLVMLPGGFSYGDYLRSGAMAAKSTIMREVIKHANAGGKVLGVCNGFQVLTESGLLPGILLRNQNLKFLCKEVFLRVENISTPFTKKYSKGQVINVPIAHHDGNYFADADMLKKLDDNAQVAFRYCDSAGSVSAATNPNGSQQNIAGIFNEKKNVLGMMPHPERHAEALLGGTDGAAIFESLLAA
ncbi:MAG: phosphoribosylformylglycinamidine synthase subunit PurQ [Alphaproteobacteria bacterium]|nr:phosphoribosylformylglycinamidine synthase subunit PurQ [Alphaproteobacteria bacterium]